MFLQVVVLLGDGLLDLEPRGLQRRRLVGVVAPAPLRLTLGEEADELRVEAVVAEVVLLAAAGGGPREREEGRRSGAHGRPPLLPHRGTYPAVSSLRTAATTTAPAL